MKTKRVLSFLLCGLLSAVACGDDDGGGSGSGVDADKPVEDLSVDEAMDLCEAVRAAGPTKEQSCTFAGVLEDDEASCEAAAKACVEDPSNDSDCSDFQEDLKGCTAKTGDIETCFTEQAALFRRAFMSLSCADAGTLTVGGDDGEGEEEELSAACTAVRAVCPDLVGDF